MDPVLSSVLQTNRIGSDGFVWWIGQIESSADGDFKNGGRFRVRIVGEHLKSCDATPTEQLPWAQSMMPLTHPYSDGGTTGGSVNLQPGNWVLGFFLDPVEKQKPMIMGSIAHTPGSTVVKNEDPTPGEDGCKSFTTYTQPNVKPTHQERGDEPNQVDEKTGANTAGGTTSASTAHLKDKSPAALLAALGSNSETNTGGTKVCVTVANPKCGTESSFDKSLKNVVSEMLAANSGSSASVGNKFVSGANGFLYDQTSIARYHIGRVNRLVTSLMGRVQSEMIKYIRQGIEWIVKTVLGLNVPEEQAKQVPLDPEATHEKTRPEGNILKRVKKTLDKLLESLGCSIEDIIERLTEWLTDLLFNYLMEVFSPAACFITDLVEGVLNHIMGLIDGLIGKIMGPLESIMSVIGGSGNIMGNVFSSVMSFLGITCSGPDAECKQNVCICNDGSSCDDQDDQPDWLDQLIGEIEEGDTGDRFVCDDAKDYPDEKNTNIIFLGGVPQAPLPTIPTGGSTPPGSIGNVPTPDSFFPPTAVDPANDPDITPSMPDDEDDIIDNVNDYMDDIASGGDGTGNGTGDGSFEDGYDDGNSTDEDDLPELPIDANGNRYYSVVADPDYVYDTETITFTVYTSNVPENHQLNYTLSGITITEDTLAPGDPNQDDDNNALTGTFGVIKKTVVTDQTVNSEGVFEDVDIVIGATPIQVTLADDAQTLAQQKMKFTLHETVSGVVPLNGFTISQSGTGYSVADAYLTTTTGSGVGLTINVTEVDADGKITGATIAAPGFGYLIGETVSISGGNYDSVITIDAVEDVFTEHADTEIIIAGNLDELIYPDGAPLSTSTLVNYQVSADKKTYNEGEDVVMTITTQNVPDGTKGEYLIYGDVTANDLVQDSLSGKFVVRDNTAVVTIGLLDDLEDENDESLYFTIVGYDATEVVTINGTYVAPTTSTEPEPPAIDRPTAGDPITDPRGSIISIPIDDKGDPYYEPPKVLITGAGYGATGIALLDASGYVSEIRVTRGGLNYKENLPSSSDVRCIIDSFTMIAPGIRYETVPKVYVDGKTGVAKAVIDDRGMVVSVQILDRTIIYDHTPKIVIAGGGGMGAFAMPSMICLSEEDLEAAKYVKIGTGKYIDCP